jgi:Glycosyl transferase family 90
VLLLILSIVAITTIINQQHTPALPHQREPASNHAPQPDHEPPSYPATSHPMWSLITQSQKEFEDLKARQSTTLHEAVAEYRRRYGIPPPPNFDKWYNFAKENGVQLIDEFDTIHQSLTPFWGLKPATIRARAREALGYDNNLLGVLIRHGNITKIDGGREWMQEALKGMTEKFISYLPDMDLCFNIHDEPRVMLQHDDLARLVATALNIAMPAANAVPEPRNQWSWHPIDMNDGTRIEEAKRTRFNRMNYQASWTHSRLSCSPDSAARSLEEEPEDNFNSYAVGALGFIYNHTAFSDICNSPSFRNSYGFFAGPNAFSVVQDLFPIFSQSKISSFQDIIYPSPWYWYGKVTYDEKLDMEWREKEDKMYWRGSTTGGYARDGGWRFQHRQRFVSRVNAADRAKILQSTGGDTSSATWTTKDVFRPDFADIFDVKFSEIGQCDLGDCRAQKEYFTVAPKAAQSDAWQSKYLLDIDGNAFSGRFYAFLKSKSLIYKLAVFREWHAEFVKPWVHYVPLSLRGEEWIESVRWFAGVDEGRREAERIALAGRDWANKALRNGDMEVWFFRLLLE